MTAAQADTRAKLAKISPDECGVLVDKKLLAPNSCSKQEDKCNKRDCERFCAAKNGGKTTYCNGGGKSWVCGGGEIPTGANRGVKETCASCIHTRKMTWSTKCEQCANAASMPANCKKDKGKQALWTLGKYNTYNTGEEVQKKAIPFSCKPESLTAGDWTPGDLFGSEDPFKGT